MDSGLLKKICRFVKWPEDDEEGYFDDLQEIGLALMICLLGPRDVPKALNVFLKHDGYGFVVQSSLQRPRRPK